MQHWPGGSLLLFRGIQTYLRQDCQGFQIGQLVRSVERSSTLYGFAPRAASFALFALLCPRSFVGYQCGCVGLASLEACPGRAKDGLHSTSCRY